MTVAGRPLRSWAADRRTMEGTWFEGAAARRRSVAVVPAMATPARFDHRFAAHLAGLLDGVASRATGRATAGGASRT